MSFESSIIDDLCEVCALLGHHQLPYRISGQGQQVHLHSVLVHPVAPLVQVGLQRIDIRNRFAKINQGFRISGRQPMCMQINRDGPVGFGARRPRRPPGLQVPLLRRFW